MLTSLLIRSVLVGLITSFFLTLASKWGWTEYLQVHADEWVYKLIKKDSSLFNQLFSCNFCMSWWMSWVFSLFLLLITRDWTVLAVPFFSTQISRRLL